MEVVDSYFQRYFRGPSFFRFFCKGIEPALDENLSLALMNPFLPYIPASMVFLFAALVERAARSELVFSTPLSSGLKQK